MSNIQKVVQQMRQYCPDEDAESECRVSGHTLLHWARLLTEPDRDLSQDIPKKGDRWKSKETGMECRVMADPVENYVIARYRGAMPFVTHVSVWGDLFERSK